MKRVAITGMGIISPIGNDTDTVFDSLVSGYSGIKKMAELNKLEGLGSLVAGTVDKLEPKKINRRHRRTMGRMSVMASLAALDAVSDANLTEDDITSARTGLAMGSTTGSADAIEEMFGNFIKTGGFALQEGTTFMKVMSHSISANVAAMLGIKGRLHAPCSACASSTQAIGLGYETIKDQ